ncbi:HD domain-containing protein [Marinospirillum celere]|uniref:HD domain-containing protein n=1 Tax=Marinospirillum celere TaxID=1122252 RepID=A0A1I1F337_9GAMM|nr:HD domain-containing phosphohydrolase [Marinospirillum celere]SFB91580.1 HD domain-containing protein [Marinospirillum celere]
MLEKLRPGELTVGKRTTMDIYTKGGRLLLSKGAHIANDQQVEVLMERGLVKRDPSDRQDYSSDFKPFRYSANVNPFLEIEELESQLETAFKQIKSQNAAAPDVFYRKIHSISSQLLGLAERAPEALLGTVHWPRQDEVPYSIHHPIQCAVLLAVISKKINFHGERLFSTLAAALTQNLGMLHFHDKLNRQKTPLTEEQNEAIRHHPQRSVEFLERMKITDPIWLQAVRDHHERLDGSGYPESKTEQDICNEAKLIALADIYVALISNREYRDALSVKQALRQIFSERGTLVGPGLTKLFLNQIGIYPPGTPVKLANGDTAVVTKRGVNINHPVCAGIRAISGQVYMHPPPRDTSDPQYAVQEIVSAEVLKPLQPFLFWGVHVRKAIEL